MRTPEQAAKAWAYGRNYASAGYWGKVLPEAQLEAAKRAYVSGHITIDIFERRAEAAILAGA